MNLEELFGWVDDWFLSDPDKLQRASVLALHGRQREQWFATEMMAMFQVALGDLRWFPEVRFTPDTRCTLDFVLRTDKGHAFIEVAAAMCGFQPSRRWNGHEVVVEGDGIPYTLVALRPAVVQYSSRLKDVQCADEEAHRLIVVFVCPAIHEEKATEFAAALGAQVGPQIHIELAHFNRSRGSGLAILWLKVV